MSIRGDLSGDDAVQECANSMGLSLPSDSFQRKPLVELIQLLASKSPVEPQLKVIFITFDEVGLICGNSVEIMKLRNHILSVWKAYRERVLPPGLTVYFYMCKHVDLATVDTMRTLPLEFVGFNCAI